MNDKEIQKDEAQVGAASTNENSVAGSKPESYKLIERADTAAERLEKENARVEENIRRLEELEARRRLGGMTETKQPEEKKEPDYLEIAQKALRGEIS